MKIDELALFSEKIEIQIKRLGGEVFYFTKPKSLNEKYLFCNTSIIHYDNQFVIAQRKIRNTNGKLTENWRDNPSEISLSRLDVDNFKITYLKTISQLNSFSIEDPRLTIGNSGLELWASRWKLNIEKATTDQVIISLDNHLQQESMYIPNIGKNNHVGYEKNWIPIEFTDMFVYQINDQHVVYDRITLDVYNSKGLKWNYGEIHGGTPAVSLNENSYISFFQSSLPLNITDNNITSISQRYYFVGAYIFSKTPPFKILNFTNSPILYSSFKNPFVLNSPCSIFPCGLVKNENNLIITFGINDCSSACAVIPLNNILIKF